MDITTVIGITGTTLILVAFFLNQNNTWSADNLKYDLMNFVGSGLMIVYSLLLSSVPFLILNVVWTAVSLRDVVKHLLKKKS